MHRHFNPEIRVADEKPPRRLYAILDHSEPTVVGEGAPALFSFDALDADGLDTMQFFGSDEPTVSGAAWNDYWKRSVHHAPHPASSPFSRLRLYRLDTL